MENFNIEHREKYANVQPSAVLARLIFICLADQI